MKRLLGHLKPTATTPVVTARPQFPIGLKVYSNPDSADIDVIFIHGLTGGREKTWAVGKNDPPWYSTLLPVECPTMRIMAYGYDAFVVDYASVVSENRIENHAKDLLSAIGQHRDEDETNTRPIIFVVHSLGGLVCMDTLLASRGSADSHLKDVLKSTRAIGFMGTPHSGSALAPWAERLAKFIGVLKQTNPHILAVLKSDSEVLARIQNDFHTMLRDMSDNEGTKISVTCFYEELPLPGVGMVVPKASAILPRYIQIPIHSNHMNMTKFAQAEDPGFRKVVGELKRWRKEIRAAHENGNGKKTQNQLEQNKVHSLIHTSTPEIRFPTLNPSDGVSKDFVERPEILRKMRDSLEEKPLSTLGPTSKPRVLIAQSLAGSGKSQIARRFAVEWVDNDNSRAFYWMDATSSASLDQNYRRFALDAGILDYAAYATFDISFVRDQVRKFITDYPNEWLLVFDNYDVLEVQEGDYYDINKYFPMSSRGRILITTRNREVENVVSGSLIDVGTMTESESVELFIRSANIDQNQIGNEELKVLRNIACELLGSYPLALAQGGSFLRLGYQSESSILSKLQRYEKQYLVHEAAILRGEDGTKIREYGKSLITTWDMSFEVIVQNNLAAAELLLLFGFFHNTSIPMNVFARTFSRRDKIYKEDGIDLVDGTFSWLGKLLGADLDGVWDRDARFDIALGLLRNYSLIHKMPGDSWNIHPLVHSWALIGRQHPRLNLLEDRARLAMSMLGGMYDKQADSSSTRVNEMRISMSNHLFCCLKNVQQHTKLLSLRHRSSVKATTLLRVSHIFDEGIQTSEQKSYRMNTKLSLQAYVNSCTQDGLDNISTLQALRAVAIDFINITHIYCDEFVDVVKIAIGLLPQIAASDPEIELETQELSFQLTQLSMLQNLRQYERIRRVVEESIVFVDEHKMEIDETYRLSCKSSLLATLTAPYNLADQSDEYKRHLLTRLQDFRKECGSVLDESHPTVILTETSIANLHRDLKEYDLAEKKLEMVISLCRKFPNYLSSQYERCLIAKSGLDLRTRNPGEEAETFSELVQVCSKAWGPFHPETIGHRLSYYLALSREAHKNGNSFQMDSTQKDRWEGAEDVICNGITLVLFSRHRNENEKSGLLWAGIIEQMQSDEIPGIGLDDFAYAFKIAAEVGKQSLYKDASEILTRAVKKVNEQKFSTTQKVGGLKSKLLMILRDFWPLVDSIGVATSSSSTGTPGAPSNDAHDLSEGSQSTMSGPDGDDCPSGTNREINKWDTTTLGQNILNCIRGAPNHAKPYMLFMLIVRLNLYFKVEKIRPKLPLDYRSIGFILEMATKQFGEAHTLSLHMHYISAVSCESCGDTSGRIASENQIMEQRFASISKPKTLQSLGPGAIFENLCIEYKRREWYHYSIRMYEVTLQRLIVLLGWCHEESMRTIWLLLEVYWLAEGKTKFMAAVRDLDTMYQKTDDNWKETFFVRMQSGGYFLLRQGLPEAASIVFKAVMQWLDSFPREKRHPPFVAQTLEYLGQALIEYGDEEGAREFKKEAESIRQSSAQ